MRKLNLLEEFVNKNENVMEAEDDGSVEDVETNIRQIDRLLKQLQLYEENFDDVLNNEIVCKFVF